MKHHYYFIGNTPSTHSLITALLSKNNDTKHIPIHILSTVHNDNQNNPNHSIHNQQQLSITKASFTTQTLQQSIDAINKEYTHTTQIHIIITCSSLSLKELQYIYSLSLKYTHCVVSMLPHMFSKIEHITFAHLKKLSLEDTLFNASPIQLDPMHLSYFNTKRVLITGAGGTFGSEIAIQLLHTDISELYLLGHGEYSVYKTYRKLAYLQSLGIGTHIQCIPLLCELQDKDMIEHTMNTIQPHIVFHTAAHKHVDLIEQNPIIGISSNIFVTQFTINAAKKAGVAYFVYISTDKSVDPASVYGASKLVGEEIVYTSHTPQDHSPMHTVVVRSGNILGSRGSILPLFHQQIKNNSPITVTSKACKRFFIHCNELISTLLHYMQQYHTHKKAIIAIYKDPETSIYDVATSIHSIYNAILPNQPAIKIIGLRKGEKITETFTFPQETSHTLELPNMYTITRDNTFSPINDIATLCNTLYSICYKDPTKATLYYDHTKAISLLKKHIPSFCPYSY